MNNDRPPACSPGIGEDGKQVFKLQWPREKITVNDSNVRYHQRWVWVWVGFGLSMIHEWI